MINKMLTLPPQKYFCGRPWMIVLSRFRFFVTFVLSLITSLGPTQPSPHRCRTFPFLPVQMGYGLLCGLWVWCRTNRRPCRPPLSNPSTSPRPDGSGRWDNRMAAQHLPWYLGGLATDKRTRSNERRTAQTSTNVTRQFFEREMFLFDKEAHLFSSSYVW